MSRDVHLPWVWTRSMLKQPHAHTHFLLIFQQFLAVVVYIVIFAFMCSYNVVVLGCQCLHRCT